MPARSEDVAQVVLLLGVELAEHPLEEDLRESDDGVERRAQLVAHVREELALVPAGDLELAALLLDFVEQTYVLDRDRRLVREGLDKLDLAVRKRPDIGSPQDHRADDPAFPQHRYAEDGSRIRHTDDSCKRERQWIRIAYEFMVCHRFNS